MRTPGHSLAATLEILCKPKANIATHLTEEHKSGWTIRNVLHATRLFSHSPARELANDPFTQRAREVGLPVTTTACPAAFGTRPRCSSTGWDSTPADSVLDAACGTGNLIIPAARTGALVSGLDLVPTLLEAAANRAYREGLDISLDEGTVERLPYEKNEFDVVMSMFGVMFAARPERVVAELRESDPGRGTRRARQLDADSFVGQMLGMHASYVPPGGRMCPAHCCGATSR